MTFVSRIHLAIALLTLCLPQIATAEQHITSEELPPIICPTDYFATGLFCEGQYCDNLFLSCETTSLSSWGSKTSFVDYVSEENGGQRDCPKGSAVAGLSCKGKYCDEISLLCIEANGALEASCQSSEKFSEEDGGSNLPAGYIMTGLSCSGKYCDNKQITGCFRNR